MQELKQALAAANAKGSINATNTNTAANGNTTQQQQQQQQYLRNQSSSATDRSAEV
jgi:hypothetical protein